MRAGAQERAECDCPRPDVCRTLGCIASQESIDRDLRRAKWRAAGSRLLFLAAMAIIAASVLWTAYVVGQRTTACHEAGGMVYKGLCLERPAEVTP